MSDAVTARPMFLALTPDARLDAAILDYKRRVHELVGPQRYLDHPPHMTVYLAVFAGGQDMGEAMATLAQMRAPALEIHGWHVFARDPLTGGNTLVMDPTEESKQVLRRLQARVIEVLAPLRIVAATEQRFLGPDCRLSAPQAECVRSNGFPYVGAGWHPHFTVASIRQEDWPVVERQLLNAPPRLRIHCPELALYELLEEHPRLVQAFTLEGGSASC